MVLPFVDISKIKTEDEKQIVLGVLQRAIPVAGKTNVEMHIEADFSPADFAEFMARIPHPMVKVNYDSGNSSGLGYIAHEEFAAYGDRIGSSTSRTATASPKVAWRPARSAPAQPTSMMSSPA